MLKFGKIDYINLLPFYIFLKKYIRSSQTKAMIEYHKGVPSKINKKFAKRNINMAFISSSSKKRAHKSLDIGIVANKKIQSVLLKPGTNKEDSASHASNLLAKHLELSGEVLIGDRALKEYLKNPNDYIDLVEQWDKKYNLPFVFALLCVHQNTPYSKRLAKSFLKQKSRIPYYILKKYSLSRDIDIKDIQEYLKLISYEVGYREKMGLGLFLKQTRS